MSRYVSLLLMVLFLSLSVQVACADDLRQLFPEEVAGMQLVRVHKGQDALAEIDALHGKPIPARDAVIGTYHAGTGRPAQVWVSVAESSQEAVEQVELMVKKMLAAANSPFQGYRGRNLAGVTLHQFYGMGQVHYVWATGNQAWWISTPVERGEAMLEAFLPQ